MQATEENNIIMIIEPITRGEPEDHGIRHGEEMRDLLKTLGRDTRLVLTARIPEHAGSWFLGSGRLNELKLTAEAEGCTLIIVDEDLTPLQQRNLEEFFGCELMDREAVILEIFASRARTREASLQVELARLQYMMPRVSRISAGGERQRGGVKGTKGSGETRQETDKRILRNRISELKKEIEEIRASRDRQRQDRIRGGMPLIAIAGYTNAGKSTLLNKLSGSDVFAENALFATLDPTTRRVHLPEFGPALMTDTVGFIRKLPHHLVDSFRATLEEITLSDLVLHVVDGSSPEKTVHMNTTEGVLGDLEALEIPRLLVFNKSDLADSEECKFLQTLYPDALFISAATGSGLEVLQKKVSEILKKSRSRVTLAIPYNRNDILSFVIRHYAPENIPADENGYRVEISLSDKDAGRLAPFRVDPYNV
jgi:GTP-binding protein HflX